MEPSLSSEYEHRKKLNKIRESVNNRVKDVVDTFAKIEKAKVEALKKTEEMKRSAEQEITRLEADIARSELTADMKKTLASDIDALRKEIQDRVTKLRARVSGTVIPP